MLIVLCVLIVLECVMYDSMTYKATYVNWHIKRHMLIVLACYVLECMMRHMLIV